MAKEGLYFDKIQSVLKDLKPRGGWSLCIGAGTSIPVIPDWYALVASLIKNNCQTADIIEIEKYKKMGFSADAMIQAVKNKLAQTDDEFIKLLSNEIYKPIKDYTTSKQWKSFCKIQESLNFLSITKDEWKDFYDIRENLLKNTTANFLADVVISAIQNNIGPKSILTFNGEAIFFSLLNSYYAERSMGTKNLFDRIVNSICSRSALRIPYIHCHGVIPINGVKIHRGRKAGDKLVFSEDSYLQLANNSFSWQATSFIENCIHNRVVFIGVSLTDSNMRRWLSWIHANKMKEFNENGIGCESSTEHFWINKLPESMQERVWIEETVAHLGVRLVWIDDWNQSGMVLAKMLNVK